MICTLSMRSRTSRALLFLSIMEESTSRVSRGEINWKGLSMMVDTGSFFISGLSMSLVQQLGIGQAAHKMVAVGDRNLGDTLLVENLDGLGNGNVLGDGDKIS